MIHAEHVMSPDERQLFDIKQRVKATEGNISLHAINLDAEDMLRTYVTDVTFLLNKLKKLESKNSG